MNEDQSIQAPCKDCHQSPCACINLGLVNPRPNFGDPQDRIESLVHYAPLRKVETEEGDYLLQGDNACGVNGAAAPTDYAAQVTCGKCQSVAMAMLGMTAKDFTHPAESLSAVGEVDHSSPTRADGPRALNNCPVEPAMKSTRFHL